MPKEDCQWDAWGALSIKCLTLAQTWSQGYLKPGFGSVLTARSLLPTLCHLSRPLPCVRLLLPSLLKKNKQKKEDQLKPDLPGRQWLPCSYPGLPIAADPPAYQGLGTTMMLWGCRGRGEVLTCLKGQLWPRLFPAK